MNNTAIRHKRSLQPFNQDYNLASYNIYVICTNFIYEWCGQHFKVSLSLQFYQLSALLAKICWVKVAEEIFWCCWNWGFNLGLTSNKPTHYLLDYCVWCIHSKLESIGNLKRKFFESNHYSMQLLPKSFACRKLDLIHQFSSFLLSTTSTIFISYYIHFLITARKLLFYSLQPYHTTQRSIQEPFSTSSHWQSYTKSNLSLSFMQLHLIFSRTLFHLIFLSCS